MEQYFIFTSASRQLAFIEHVGITHKDKNGICWNCFSHPRHGQTIKVPDGEECYIIFGGYAKTFVPARNVYLNIDWDGVCTIETKN